ncbi:MAG: MFS transporter [bacterium]
MNRIFRSFSHRNYRLFFSGQLVSLTGAWIQSTVQGWLIYRLTGSAFMLGLVGFGTQLPMLLLSLPGGVVADRMDKRRALIFIECLAMLQAFILGLLAVSGVIRPWHIFVMAVCLGAVNAFEMPLRQSFVVEMVGREDLSNAIALNSSAINLARMAGPAVAGMLVGLIGEGPCFLLNAASFLAVIAALLKMVLPKKARGNNAEKKPVFHSMIEGLRHAVSHHHVRAPLLLLTMTSMVTMPVMVLMPVVAVDMLGGGAGMLGYLYSCSGAGALIGALSMAWRTGRRGLGTLVSASSLLFAISLAFISFSHDKWLTGGFLILSGFGMMRQAAGCNILLQALVPDEFRGRVMSLYIMTLVGLAPLGSLIAGKGAQLIGMEWMLLLGGAWSALSALKFYFRIPDMRLSEERVREEGFRTAEDGLVI